MESKKPYPECEKCNVDKTCTRYQEVCKDFFCPYHIKKIGQTNIFEF